MIKQTVKIDVVSDVVCPWCYVGKRRLEKAIKKLDSHYTFALEYHPFELNPAIPLSGIDQRDYLINKFGSADHYQHITGRVTEVAAEEGLQLNFEKQKVMPNTRRLHAVIQLAISYEKQLETVENFFKAYFTDGVDLSLQENILSIATAAGLDKTKVEKMLLDQSSLNHVAEAENHVQKMGIRSVPFYIINSKYGLSGAQSWDIFKSTIEEAAATAVTNEAS